MNVSNITNTSAAGGAPSAAHGLTPQRGVGAKRAASKGPAPLAPSPPQQQRQSKGGGAGDHRPQPHIAAGDTQPAVAAAVTPANSAAIIDEATLRRTATAYEEEQRRKAVQWFRSIGAEPTTEAQRAEVLASRVRAAEEVARRSRGADRARLAVEHTPLPAQLRHVDSNATNPSALQQQKSAAAAASSQKRTAAEERSATVNNADGLNISPRRGSPTKGGRGAAAAGAFPPGPPIPIDLIEAVMNGTFPHDDPLEIAATNRKVDAHNKRYGIASPSSSSPTKTVNSPQSSGGPTATAATGASAATSTQASHPTRKDLLLGTGSHLASLDALTRTAHQATMIANAKAAASELLHNSSGGGGASSIGNLNARSGTPTKRSSTPPNSKGGGGAGAAAANAAAAAAAGNLNAAAAALLLSEVTASGGNAARAEDPIVTAKRQKAAHDTETDNLLRLALGGDLFVGAEGAAAAARKAAGRVGGGIVDGLNNGSGSEVNAEIANNNVARGASTPAKGAGRGDASGSGSNAANAANANMVNGVLITPQQLSDPAAIAAAATSGLVFNADGSVTTPEQLASLLQSQHISGTAAAQVKGIIDALVAGGAVPDGRPGAGLEGRAALRERFALIARIVLLRQRFDRRTAAAMRAIQQQQRSAAAAAQASAAGGGGGVNVSIGGGGGVGADSFALTAVPLVGGGQRPRGVEFSRAVTLVEMPSLLPPTGDNPLTAAIVPTTTTAAAPSAASDAANASGAAQTPDTSVPRAGTAAAGGGASPAAGKAAAKAAALAQAQALALQQQQQQLQQQQERQAVMLKLAPATVVADSQDPNSLSLLGEAIASAVDMPTLAPKKAYTPFAFRLKGYSRMPFPASQLLSASPVSAVAVLPAGPTAVPEPKTIVPSLEHFAQPMPTLDTFPMPPRQTVAPFGGLSLSETILGFDSAIHSVAAPASAATTVGSVGMGIAGVASSFAVDCHARGRSTAAAASALALHTLAPMPFVPGGNASAGVGGAFGSGALSLGPSVFTVACGQQRLAGERVVTNASSAAVALGTANGTTTATPSAAVSAFAMPSATFLNAATAPSAQLSRSQRRRAQRNANKANNSKRGNAAIRGTVTFGSNVGGTSASSPHDRQTVSSPQQCLTTAGAPAATFLTSVDSTIAGERGNSPTRRNSPTRVNTALVVVPSATAAASSSQPPAAPPTALQRTVCQLLDSAANKPFATQRLLLANSSNSSKPAGANSKALTRLQQQSGAGGFSSVSSGVAGGLRTVGAGGGGAPLRMRHADPLDDLSDDDSDDDDGSGGENTASGPIGGWGGSEALIFDSDDDAEEMAAARKQQQSGNASTAAPSSSHPHFITLPTNLSAAPPKERDPASDALAILTGGAGSGGQAAAGGSSGAAQSQQSSGGGAPKRSASPSLSATTAGGVFGDGGASDASGLGGAGAAPVGASVLSVRQQRLVAAVAAVANGGAPLPAAAQAAVIADAALMEEKEAFLAAAGAPSSARASTMDHRRHVSSTTVGATAPNRSSLPLSAAVAQPNAMLDARLSFLMSSQLRAALPTDAYSAMRPFVPLPNGARDAGAGVQGSAYAAAAHTYSYTAGLSANSGLSSVASTLQRLGAAPAGGALGAFLPPS